MVSINTAAMQPSAAEYTHTSSKSADASKAAPLNGTPTIKTTSKANLSSTAKLTATLITLQKGSSAADYSKPFAEVAKDARAILDAGQEKLGRKADTYTTYSEWKDVVGYENLNRRALFAIASNEGGMFSEAESGAARSFMTDELSRVLHPLGAATQVGTGNFKTYINFLDDVSPEEKASLEWANERSNAQRGYEITAQNEGRVPENLDSGDPVVNLLIKSFDEIVAAGNPFGDRRDMPSFKAAIDLWNRMNGKEFSGYKIL